MIVFLHMVYGFLWGIGFILAALVMKLLFKIGIMG